MLSNDPLLPPDPIRPYVKPTPENTHGGKTYTPTHPGLFQVDFGPRDEGEYSSRLIACRDFSPGEIVASLDNASLANEKAYSSVQFGPGVGDHLELNSDLLFMNHSCSPNVMMDLTGQAEKWCVRALDKGVKKGEPLTFFYPSTEWDMAQGFECHCGASDCLKTITGAKSLSLAALERRGGLSEHIRMLKERQLSSEGR
ncbi:hypothetical protein M231_04942 [Tremella mesenterica]|uniref:SET domain-containing protein n=1 Tax=Tremella mesenterica TaxID=5217 RepID=A0A4Q1BJG8_TREME|nr:uncharacterized protein TREMEDRAFT_25509 [Tremella mesenterica DSM 1558]EIW72258.1 hypothetical protein TREMEDRAFT_25509 [Tremella mesenterica DSM 1558]RXK37786.1 hypothetical protein M231_04942 [Tremella mesenterica]